MQQATVLPDAEWKRLLAVMLDFVAGDPWPHGVAANRATPETFIRYMVERHFISAAPKVEDIFPPAPGAQALPDYDADSLGPDPLQGSRRRTATDWARRSGEPASATPSSASARTIP